VDGFKAMFDAEGSSETLFFRSGLDVGETDLADQAQEGTQENEGVAMDALVLNGKFVADSGVEFEKRVPQRRRRAKPLAKHSVKSQKRVRAKERKVDERKQVKIADFSFEQAVQEAEAALVSDEPGPKRRTGAGRKKRARSKSPALRRISFGSEIETEGNASKVETEELRPNFNAAHVAIVIVLAIFSLFAFHQENMGNDLLEGTENPKFSLEAKEAIPFETRKKLKLSFERIIVMDKPPSSFWFRSRNFHALSESTAFAAFVRFQRDSCWYTPAESRFKARFQVETPESNVSAKIWFNTYEDGLTLPGRAWLSDGEKNLGEFQLETTDGNSIESDSFHSGDATGMIDVVVDTRNGSSTCVLAVDLRELK